MSDFKIPENIAAMTSDLVQIRRRLHRHPEIGYKEFETAKLIAASLVQLGFEVTTEVGLTGVVGLWKGNGESDRTVAFRADMDALPIQEENDVVYRSEINGMMHACGHDGHMAILLGFARWLSERPEPFKGNVKLIFQPGEEGYGGALKMMEDGVLENPAVEQIIGLHLWNDMPMGTVGITTGPGMGSIDGFEIRVKGRGGHSAMPHQTVDAVVVAAQITVALQSIVSRNIDPLIPSVVTVSRIEAGTADNAVAETAKMRGTVRTFDQELRQGMPARMERIVKGVADAFGADAELEWTPMYPVLVCDGETTALVKQAASSVVGAGGIIEGERTMASEDMSYFLEQIPGSFFFLGSANDEKGLNKPHHNPRFDFDESVLPVGVAIFAKVAELFFESDPHPGLG